MPAHVTMTELRHGADLYYHEVLSKQWGDTSAVTPEQVASLTSPALQEAVTIAARDYQEPNRPLAVFDVVEAATERVMSDAYNVNVAGPKYFSRSEARQAGRQDPTFAQDIMAIYEMQLTRAQADLAGVGHAARKAARAKVEAAIKLDTWHSVGMVGYPDLGRDALPLVLKSHFDEMKHHYEEWCQNPVKVYDLNAKGRAFKVMYTITDDSFRVQIFTPAGELCDDGSGFGTPDQPVAWD
jgi:hypothetical protein